MSWWETVIDVAGDLFTDSDGDIDWGSIIGAIGGGVEAYGDSKNALSLEDLQNLWMFQNPNQETPWGSVQLQRNDDGTTTQVTKLSDELQSFFDTNINNILTGNLPQYRVGNGLLGPDSVHQSLVNDERYRLGLPPVQQTDPWASISGGPSPSFPGDGGSDEDVPGYEGPAPGGGDGPGPGPGGQMGQGGTPGNLGTGYNMGGGYGGQGQFFNELGMFGMMGPGRGPNNNWYQGSKEWNAHNNDNVWEKAMDFFNEHETPLKWAGRAIGGVPGAAASFMDKVEDWWTGASRPGRPIDAAFTPGSEFQSYFQNNPYLLRNLSPTQLDDYNEMTGFEGGIGVDGTGIGVGVGAGPGSPGMATRGMAGFNNFGPGRVGGRRGGGLFGGQTVWVNPDIDWSTYGK